MASNFGEDQQQPGELTPVDHEITVSEGVKITPTKKKQVDTVLELIYYLYKKLSDKNKYKELLTTQRQIAKKKTKTPNEFKEKLKEAVGVPHVIYIRHHNDGKETNKSQVKRRPDIEILLKWYGFGSNDEAQKERKLEFLRSELFDLIHKTPQRKWPKCFETSLGSPNNPITDVHKVGKLPRQHWTERQPDTKFVIMEVFLIMFAKGVNKDEALTVIEKDKLHGGCFSKHMVLTNQDKVNRSKEEVYNLNTGEIVSRIKETLKRLISDPISPVIGYMYLPLFGGAPDIHLGKSDDDTLISWIFELHNQGERNEKIADGGGRNLSNDLNVVGGSTGNEADEPRPKKGNKRSSPTLAVTNVSRHRSDEELKISNLKF